MYPLTLKEGPTHDIDSSVSYPLLVHFYPKLVKTAETISIFIDKDGCFSAVLGQEAENRLLVYTDRPILGKQTLPHLKKYLAQSYAIVEKRKSDFSRVRITLALPGGGLGDDMLPGHAGYSIGDVIEKKFLPLSKWKEQRYEIEEQLKFKAKELIREKSRPPSELFEQQRKVNECIADMNRLRFEHEEVSKKIRKISKEPTYLEKSLPIDRNKSPTRFAHNSFYSEKMDHFTLEGKNGLDEQELSTRLNELMSRVFSGDGAFTYLPPGTVDKVTQGISSILSSKSQVFVIGSFVTLPRSKIIDPVILRANAEIDQDLVGKGKGGKFVSDNYVVLTETVLGGVFLGYGKVVCSEEGESVIIDNDQKSVLSSSQTTAISFISQGAIPKIGTEPDVTNLWGAYINWKESLCNDPQGGYPIGYKYTNLTDILRENNRSLKDGRREEKRWNF